MKKVIRRIFQKQTADYIEFLEFFEDGKIEIAVYEKKKKTLEKLQ